MAESRLRTFAEVLEVVRPAFTRPTFERFVALMRGWLLTQQAGAVTSALLGAGLAGRAHHAAFHRVFAEAAWDVDEVGTELLKWIVRTCATRSSLQLAIDDTVVRKKGPMVFGLGTYLDPVRSSRRVRNFVFGHLWVVLVAIVRSLTPRQASRVVMQLPALYRTRLRELPPGPDRSISRASVDAETARELGVEPTRAAEIVEGVGRALVHGTRLRQVLSRCLPRDLATILRESPRFVPRSTSRRPRAARQSPASAQPR